MDVLSNSYTKAADLQMFVNFLGFPVALEQSTEDPHTSHPDDLLWHTGISCSLPFAWNNFSKIFRSLFQVIFTIQCPR